MWYMSGCIWHGGLLSGGYLSGGICPWGICPDTVTNYMVYTYYNHLWTTYYTYYIYLWTIYYTYYIRVFNSIYLLITKQLCYSLYVFIISLNSIHVLMIYEVAWRVWKQYNFYCNSFPTPPLQQWFKNYHG